METTTGSLLRVEKGHAEPEEPAAITTILLARVGIRQEDGIPALSVRSTAGWRRLERTPGFRAPHSWQG
ncbi:acyl-CoA carboxylase subunit epsilon [Streptomyces sp. NPDC051320]|uniref:acyl-CoA carboxylase subunit epsilon n=1 Tax=Streptomyces sp. NPDC051320 TaxID=3154644 RepID=UPI003418AC3E